MNPSLTSRNDRRTDARAFDATALLLGAWMIFGIHLDAWAHHRFALESFFTPWHGVLYLGFLALAALYVGRWIVGRRGGLAWREAMPAGYAAALIGVPLFLAGGVGDLIWHELFGIEVGTEALLSPTHLLLGLGGGLMIAGPWRAALARPEKRRADAWIALGSLALLLAVLSFFTAYANPLTDASELLRGARPESAELVERAQSLGMASLLVQVGLVSGLGLFAASHLRLPFGTLTALVTLSSGLALLTHEDFRLLPFMALAGLSADALLAGLGGVLEREAARRAFGFGLAALYAAAFMVGVALSGGVWWSVHLWSGAILVAGAVGWLLAAATPAALLPIA